MSRPFARIIATSDGESVVFMLDAADDGSDRACIRCFMRYAGATHELGMTLEEHITDERALEIIESFDEQRANNTYEAIAKVAKEMFP